jgi:predicted DCC family thiol-disulfide oxidoreductase YuxK
MPQAPSPPALAADDSPCRGVLVVYDGECPLCSGYCNWLRGNSQDGDATYLDGRSLPRDVQAALNLEQGMIVIAEDRRSQGAEALQVLAGVSTHRGPLAAIYRRFFGCGVLAKASYPVLRLARRLLLFILGRAAF